MYQPLVTIRESSLQKPSWLHIRPPSHRYPEIKAIQEKYKIATVCQEAHCPNLAECWSTGTVTFMVMGDTCTRGCRFCQVKTARTGNPLDPQEPQQLVKALAEMRIFDYVVITSVDRDDLEDQGSSHFAACIQAIKQWNPKMLVEVLIPDFRGSEACLQQIINARPNVIGHNIETVERLQRKVRDGRATYIQSLHVLAHVKKTEPSIVTKSSLMLGLGEQPEEVVHTMRDLRSHGVTILTLGQYLQPSKKHLPVVEYVHPEQFNRYREIGESLGFAFVAAGPLVRSSYKAGELFTKYYLQSDHQNFSPKHAQQNQKTNNEEEHAANNPSAICS
ncbi:lipoyl synthase [Candidatus Woesearchaeota archaeon]|nr:lipoyl synthase [Candidatus Woesearchaeota archaeon]